MFYGYEGSCAYPYPYTTGYGCTNVSGGFGFNGFTLIIVLFILLIIIGASTGCFYKR